MEMIAVSPERKDRGLPGSRGRYPPRIFGPESGRVQSVDVVFERLRASMSGRVELTTAAGHDLDDVLEWLIANEAGDGMVDANA
jgi:hypothetical protein